jgi:alcohol dehydrogenase
MEFFNPVSIFHGSGIRSRLENQCKDKSVLIFCTKTALSRYKEDHILSDLVNKDNFIFEHSYSNNPSIKDIISISEKHNFEEFDLIIGIGGGSTLDIAKISSVSIPAFKNGIDFNQLLDDPELFNKFKKIETILVPTTAGTGSEATPFATVWDYEKKIKKSLSNKKLYASATYIDPDFLVNCPYDVLVSTGLDSLNQAFESIWNVNSSSISSIYALHSASLSLKSLLLIDEINQIDDVRSSLSKASLYAGIAISQTRTSICHSISYPLTLKFGLPHGLACAFSMKEVYKFNKKYIEKEMHSLGNSIQNDPYELILEIYKKLNIENKIIKYIKEPNEISSIVKDMTTVGRFENNIRQCSLENLNEIICKSIKHLSG